MNMAGALAADGFGAWSFRPGAWLVALAERLAPRHARPRPAARGAAAPAPAAPDPDLVRRFRAAAMPLLDDAYSYARYLCRDASAAEDIVHDAYLRALRGFAGFRGDELRPWLFAIVRNCFYSQAKAAGRAPVSAPPEAADEIADETLDTPEDVLIRGEENEAIAALIHALPDHYREVLVLRELEELSYREIAAAIGAPTGTVMSRLARARALLADAWRKREAAGALA